MLPPSIYLLLLFPLLSSFCSALCSLFPSLRSPPSFTSLSYFLLPYDSSWIFVLTQHNRVHQEYCTTTTTKYHVRYSTSSPTLALRNQNFPSDVCLFSAVITLFCSHDSDLFFSSHPLYSRIESWRDVESRKQLFISYAKEHAFDPLHPTNWYSQPFDRILSFKVQLFSHLPLSCLFLVLSLL